MPITDDRALTFMKRVALLFDTLVSKDEDNQYFFVNMALATEL